MQQNVCLDEYNDDLKTVFGNFDNEFLKEADIVVVSPGVPLEKYGLFSMLCSVSIISPSLGGDLSNLIYNFCYVHIEKEVESCEYCRIIA